MKAIAYTVIGKFIKLVSTKFFNSKAMPTNDNNYSWYIKVVISDHFKKLHNLHSSVVKYHIVGKFGGENAWRIYSFQAFGRKSLANERSAKWLLIYNYYFGCS